MAKDWKNKFKEKGLKMAEEIEERALQESKDVFKIDISHFNYDFSTLNLNENEEKQLLDITKEFHMIQTKNRIMSGILLNRAFDVFSKEGFYEEWLSIVGIEKRTALRNRKRATVYNLADENNKPYVASLPQPLIEKIFADNSLLDNLDNLVIEYKDKKVNKEKLVEEVYLDNFEDDLTNTFSSLITKLPELDEDSKTKIYKLVQQLTKLLQ